VVSAIARLTAMSLGILVKHEGDDKEPTGDLN
jgi:hypothetical protein